MRISNQQSAISNQQSAISNQQSADILDKNSHSPNRPIYQKPRTSLFLVKATDIHGGATQILESQGDGYLTS